MNTTQLYNQLKNEGGFSINAQQENPTNGFMVSFAHSETIIPFDLLTPHLLASLKTAYTEKIGEDFFGAWHNEENNLVYVDVSQNLQNLQDAIRQGEKEGQLAIFDVSNFDTIPIAE